MNITPVLRDYLCSRIPGCDHIFDTFSTAELKDAIEDIYIGGYDQFARDYLGRPGRGGTETEITRKVYLRDVLGIRHFGGKEVLYIRERDTEIDVVMRVAAVRDSTFRETETHAELRIYTYNRDNKKCLSIVRVPDECVTYVSGHARLVTPERFADSLDQYLICYRPGTERQPLDGPQSLRSQQDTKYWYQLLDLGLVNIGDI